MPRRLGLLTLCLLTLAFTVPAVAQDSGIILQLSAPFFAEDILTPVIEEYEAANPGIQVNSGVVSGLWFAGEHQRRCRSRSGRVGRLFQSGGCAAG